LSRDDGRRKSQRRRSSRIDTDNWTVTIDLFKMGRIKNLSTNGLYVSTDEDLEIGSTVSVEFFPPNTDKLILIKAEVIWKQKNNFGDVLGVGVDFLSLTEDEKKVISHYLGLVEKEADERR